MAPFSRKEKNDTPKSSSSTALVDAANDGKKSQDPTAASRVIVNPVLGSGDYSEATIKTVAEIDSIVDSFAFADTQYSVKGIFGISQGVDGDVVTIPSNLSSNTRLAALAVAFAKKNPRISFKPSDETWTENFKVPALIADDLESLRTINYGKPSFAYSSERPGSTFKAALWTVLANRVLANTDCRIHRSVIPDLIGGQRPKELVESFFNQLNSLAKSESEKRLIYLIRYSVPKLAEVFREEILEYLQGINIAWKTIREESIPHTKELRKVKGQKPKMVSEVKEFVRASSCMWIAETESKYLSAFLKGSDVSITDWKSSWTSLKSHEQDRKSVV